jgi:hypothetical protein
MYEWKLSHDLGDSLHLDIPIWKDIVSGLQVFRAISRVTVGDGASTGFWADLWLGDNPLLERLPDLYSHSTRIHINV